MDQFSYSEGWFPFDSRQITVALGVRLQFSCFARKQKASYKRDSRCHAHHRPGIIMHKIIRLARGTARPLGHFGLDLGKCVLAIANAPFDSVRHQFQFCPYSAHKSLLSHFNLIKHEEQCLERDYNIAWLAFLFLQSGVKELNHGRMGESEKPAAWEPLSFGGVARFAYAPGGRLLLVCLLVAALCGGVVVWFLNFRWVPQIESAIAHLPEQAAIRNGALVWPGKEPIALAQSSFLTLTIQPGRVPELASGSDFEVSLGARQIGVRSFFGYLPVAYPYDLAISLNQAEVQPWWGAWKPAFLAGAGTVTGVALLLMWFLLGILYMPLIKLLGFYADRHVSWLGARRCATAAMLTAALLMCASIVLYAFQEISLLGLLAVVAAHFLVQLIYALGATMALDDLPGRKIAGNPFAAPEVSQTAEAGGLPASDSASE
jgi:hypothetical protein